jgi:hypothetical protein
LNLIANSTHFTPTVSTDDFAGWLALQTNLALKGIIGIKAMSKLTQVAGFADEASSYLVCPSFLPRL